MNILADREMGWLIAGVLGVLVTGSVSGRLLAWKVHSPGGQMTVANLNARVRAWWLMCAMFAVALAIGGVGSVLLFFLLSVLALREFMTLAPTRVSDHRTLLGVFYVLTPVQYLLVATQWYGLFAVLIPVYGFLLVPTLSALRADSKDFLARTAIIQWGLMICVYSVSHAPALLMLDLPGYDGPNAKLLLFFTIVVQASDVLQYVWGKLRGRHPIAPAISPNKTWEGFVGGGLSATLLGMALWWVTPFNPLQAAGMSLVIVLMGFAGGLTMSAIKRDRGIKDFGAMLPGHGGVLDRIDSLCFAAPVFFHLTRFFFG